MRLYVIDYFSHRRDLLCIFIRDLKVEFIFKLHDQFDDV